MTGNEFYDVVKDGDTVYLNKELWFGQGQGKEIEIVKKDTPGIVIWKHVGFFDYFLHVEMQGKQRRLRIESLDVQHSQDLA